MSDPSLELQRALFARLRDDDGVKALIAGRVYDKVPTGAVFPYVTIGEGQTIGDDDDCGEYSDVHPQIHVWSRAEGLPEAKTISAAIRASLRASPLSLSGFTVVETTFVQLRTVRDPDGLTSHAIIEYRFLISHNS